MSADDLLAIFAQLPDEGVMRHIRAVTPKGVAPADVFRALHTNGWIVNLGGARWRKCRALTGGG